MARCALRTPWRRGPADGFDGPVLVSVTDFRLYAAQDLPGAYRAAMRLRRAWPELDGAVGMWLWAKPLQKRSGSVSVWRGEADLNRFVRWPVHVAIMRKYRVAGEITSTSWHAEGFVADQAWREAVGILSADELSEEPDPNQRAGR